MSSQERRVKLESGRESCKCNYGVATVSRLLKIIGLFCRIQPLLQGSFVKETYNFKEPTNRSLPILIISARVMTILFSRE